MTAPHLISIVLPVYNGEKFLKEAIWSCLNQSYDNFELIIVNDFSRDRTLTIAEEWAAKDSRIKIINNSYNKKLPESLNVGHHLAKGEFITWTSDDNILKKDFLKLLYIEIQKENCDVVYSNYDIIWEDGSLKREHVTGPITKLLFGDCIGASFLYRKKVFTEIGGYNPELFLVEDYHFFFKASLVFRFKHLEENLYKYRIHGESLTGKIHRSIEYKIKHENALRQMYQDVATHIQLRKATIDTILDLYFNNPLSLEKFLHNADIIKKDVELFQKKLKSDEEKPSIYFLEEGIRRSWLNNEQEQTLSNLLLALKKNKSLFGRKFNRNATFKLIYLCLKLRKKSFSSPK